MTMAYFQSVFMFFTAARWQEPKAVEHYSKKIKH